MCREIEYRAKDNLGNWAYGYVATVKLWEGFSVWKIFNDANGVEGTPVVPKTIGQYTGIKDKNGVKIYEGDKFLDHFDNGYGFIFKDDSKACFMVKINEYLHDEFESIMENIIPMYELDFDYIEVIGNIHEDKK